MKSYRLEFQKGINVVGDKAVIQPGFLDVAENVDLRSGMPRPIKNVEISATVNPTITRVFEYRGKLYKSERWRDYQTEYVNGRDRIYYSESGEVASTVTLNPPSKIIEGVEVKLGTLRPKVAPKVTATDGLTPIVSASITLTSGLTSSATAIIGNYNKNQSTSFRLAMRDTNGTHTPSSPIYNQFVTDGSSVTYSWKQLEGAIGYNVFIGTLQGMEQKVTELGASATMYIDTGVYQGTGEFAANYDTKAPYSYFYTFLRDVNTVQDESAPSPLSITVETGKTRQIVFDTLSDGFFSQPGYQSVTTASITIKASEAYAGYYPVSSYEYNPNRQQVKIMTAQAHTMKTGDRAFFRDVGDPNWDNQIFPIIADTHSLTLFYIKNVSPPAATITNGTYTYPATIFNGFVVPAKSLVTVPSSADPCFNGDAIYINISNTLDSRRVFAATACASFPSFEIGAYSATGATATLLKYVPHNGYIKYRNLYRTGDTDQYALVKRVPVTTDRWIDGATMEYIDGTPPDSFYVEDGKTIIYDVPPLGMTSLTQHYGMMFGIDGNNVRWTPTGRPDAWPTIFSVRFPYKPLALSSWGQSLIILCLDGIYRLDGNIPTQMSLSQTQVGNGCIAPHSVQKTHAGLVYLSTRGIMLFNGSTSICLTDGRIMSSFFTGPSSAPLTINYMWQPTLLGYNYANLANADGISSLVPKVNNLQDTRAIDGPIHEIKSFYHLGKYYMFWAKQGPTVQPESVWY